MSIEAHLNSLAAKRIQLKQRISEESARPAPDFVVITDLKKLNLSYKEEMQQCLIRLGKRKYKVSS